MDNSGFFKEVLWNLSSYYSATTSKFHFQVFSKSAWIIIDNSACIPKCFYKVVHLENLLLQSPVISLDIKKILLQIISDYSNSCIFRCCGSEMANLLLESLLVSGYCSTTPYQYIGESNLVVEGWEARRGFYLLLLGWLVGTQLNRDLT